MNWQEKVNVLSWVKEIITALYLGQLGQRWSTIEPESVLTIVHGKVELPSRWVDKVTGCSRKQGLLSVSPQHWRWKRDAPRAKSQTLSHCENRLIVSKVIVCGSQDLKSDKPSKNNARMSGLVIFSATAQKQPCLQLTFRSQRLFDFSFSYCVLKKFSKSHTGPFLIDWFLNNLIV